MWHAQTQTVTAWPSARPVAYMQIPPGLQRRELYVPSINDLSSMCMISTYASDGEMQESVEVFDSCKSALLTKTARSSEIK
eukprot:IDg13655t1